MNIKSITNTESVASTSKAQVKNNSQKSFQSFLGESESLDAIFQKAADKYGVDVKLLKAIGKAESDFNPNSTSHCGAMGIMQLMPETAKGLGVKDAYDPEQNIMGGAKLISGLLKKYDGDVKLALAGYNAGTGNVRKYGGVPPFKETQNYIKKVLKYSGSKEQVSVNTGSASSSQSSTETTTTEATLSGSGQSSSAVPAAGTYTIPSGYQLKKAQEEAEVAASVNMSTQASTSLGTGTSEAARTVTASEATEDKMDAITLMKQMAAGNSSQLTAYLHSLEESGQAKDINDIFSYDDYLKFMSIFFKEQDEEEAAAQNYSNNTSATEQIQMSASIRNMLRNM
ncbi:MAG: lytic transglycosylase domain-containing protein [bacterium]|nr:lytic transglycosylase domain-containing protein [bacterium]